MTPTKPPPTPMDRLAQCLRDELIAVRMSAGLKSTRAVARALQNPASLDGRDSGHINYFEFERGKYAWPEDPVQRVQDYADASTAAGHHVTAEHIWQNVAARWHRELLGKGADSAVHALTRRTD